MPLTHIYICIYIYHQIFAVPFNKSLGQKLCKAKLHSASELLCNLFAVCLRLVSVNQAKSRDLLLTIDTPLNINEHYLRDPRKVNS